jgi:hypothetical protein
MARKAGRSKSILATDREGKELFAILASTGIHWLSAFNDGLTLVYFGLRDGPYVRVEEAVAWHERELQESRGLCGDGELLAAMRLALTKFRAGEVEING